jgi:hypothetical protein
MSTDTKPIIAGRVTEENRLLLLQILALALTTPKAVADIHVNYSAHVNRVDVGIYPGGYDACDERQGGVGKREFYEGYLFDEYGVLQHLADLRAILTRIHEVRGSDTALALVAAATASNGSGVAA